MNPRSFEIIQRFLRHLRNNLKTSYSAMGTTHHPFIQEVAVAFKLSCNLLFGFVIWTSMLTLRVICKCAPANCAAITHYL